MDDLSCFVKCYIVYRAKYEFVIPIGGVELENYPATTKMSHVTPLELMSSDLVVKREPAKLFVLNSSINLSSVSLSLKVQPRSDALKHKNVAPKSVSPFYIIGLSSHLPHLLLTPRLI